VKRIGSDGTGWDGTAVVVGGRSFIVVLVVLVVVEVVLVVVVGAVLVVVEVLVVLVVGTVVVVVGGPGQPPTGTGKMSPWARCAGRASSSMVISLKPPLPSRWQMVTRVLPRGWGIHPARNMVQNRTTEAVVLIVDLPIVEQGDHRPRLLRQSGVLKIDDVGGEAGPAQAHHHLGALVGARRCLRSPFHVSGHVSSSSSLSIDSGKLWICSRVTSAGGNIG
jgi:hypothetical protein